ncbi:MAG: hypothetical protein ABSB77_25620, partial [Xanthobacteraceae bacterium]
VADAAPAQRQLKPHAFDVGCLVCGHNDLALCPCGKVFYHYVDGSYTVAPTTAVSEMRLPAAKFRLGSREQFIIQGVTSLRESQPGSGGTGKRWYQQHKPAGGSLSSRTNR